MVCVTNMAAIVLFLMFLDSRNFFSPLFAFKIKKKWSHLTCVLIYALSYKVFNAVSFKTSENSNIQDSELCFVCF